MPNQNNFRSDVITPTDSRFIASRIVNPLEDNVLLEQLPASVGFSELDNIEIHFYVQPSNELVVSAVISSDDTGILKSHVVAYEDGTFKNYISIDFTALFEKNNLVLLPGDYKTVLNFFSDEIGSYDNKIMYIQNVSESRTEVQLAFFASQDIEERIEKQDTLRKFTPPAFAKADAVGASQKIFKSGVDLDNEFEGLLYPNIIDNISISTINQTFENTIERVRRLGQDAENNLSKDLHEVLLEVYENIRERIVIEGDNRIQEDEFREFINESVTEVFRKYNFNDGRIIIT